MTDITYDTIKDEFDKLRGAVDLAHSSDLEEIRLTCDALKIINPGSAEAVRMNALSTASTLKTNVEAKLTKLDGFMQWLSASKSSLQAAADAQLLWGDAKSQAIKAAEEAGAIVHNTETGQWQGISQEGATAAGKDKAERLQALVEVTGRLTDACVRTAEITSAIFGVADTAIGECVETCTTSSMRIAATLEYGQGLNTRMSQVDGALNSACTKTSSLRYGSWQQRAKELATHIDQNMERLRVYRGGGGRNVAIPV